MTKSNGTLWKWISAAGIITLILTCVWQAAIMSRDLNKNCEDDAAKHQVLQQQATINREAILKIETKLEYIIEGVDEIKKELKNQ